MYCNLIIRSIDIAGVRVYNPLITCGCSEKIFHNNDAPEHDSMTTIKNFIYCNCKHKETIL